MPSSDTVLVGITLEMPVTIISSLVTVPTGVLVPVVKYSLVEERVGVKLVVICGETLPLVLLVDLPGF